MVSSLGILVSSIDFVIRVEKKENDELNCHEKLRSFDIICSFITCQAKTK